MVGRTVEDAGVDGVDMTVEVPGTGAAVAGGSSVALGVDSVSATTVSVGRALGVGVGTACWPARSEDVQPASRRAVASPEIMRRRRSLTMALLVTDPSAYDDS